MDLDYLKLNRNLYRRNSKYEDTDINTATYYADGYSGETDFIATEVAEGTVISSAIWQTSGGGNRIELLPDDTLTSYDNNAVGFRLEPGLVISNNPIVYDGVQQPVVYAGRFSISNPSSTNLPPGWTATVVTGSGTAVILTHNLNNDQIFVNVTNYILSAQLHQVIVTSNTLNTIILIGYQATYNGAGAFTGYDANAIDSFDFTATRYIV